MCSVLLLCLWGWTVLTATTWTLVQRAGAAGTSYSYGGVVGGSSSSSSATNVGDPLSTGGKLPPMQRLNLWIGGDETKQFVGVPIDIFVIKGGEVVPYLLDAHMTQHLPVLPPEVHVVKLTWQATDDIYEYRFSRLTSLDPKTLFDPLISIPSAGIVPREKTDERTICRFDCKNGGRCNARGECECRPGYLGQQCQLVSCLPECQNNGTCISPRKCQCARGYVGPHCETPVCRRPCQNGGLCVSPDKCRCTAEYYGSVCQTRKGKCRIPCKHGGICKRDNTCDCPRGYIGEFCQRPICRQSCGVHGRCIDHNQCGCKRGWRGRSCNKTVNRMSHGSEKRRKKRRKTEHGPWRSRRERRRQLRKRARRRHRDKRV